MKLLINFLTTIISSLLAKKLISDEKISAPDSSEEASEETSTSLLDIYTADKVKKMFPKETPFKNIEVNLPLILEALGKKGMGSKPYILYALATIRVESAGFKPISEFKSKYNTDKEPFDKYDFRKDLGNNGKGVGKKFSGRGFIQITGKANYQLMDTRLNLEGELVKNPDYANIPEIAAAILAEYFLIHKKRIDKALETNDLKQLRKIVNGGLIHYDKFESSWTIGEGLFYFVNI